MKIPELRQLLAQYPEKDLRLLLVEIYRRIPQGVITQKQIDDLLTDPQVFLQKTGKKKKQPVLPDFESLSLEVERFLENAREGNYFKPNRFVHKKARPKWRFMVKQFHRDLVALISNSDEVHEISCLLEQLYQLLHRAEEIYLFSTDDPFHSVGISKVDFYGDTMKAYRAAASDLSWICRAIGLLLRTDRYGSHDDFIDRLVQELNTAPLKERALQDIIQARQHIPTLKNKSYSYSNQDKIDLLDAIALTLEIALGEHQRGIATYQRHSSGVDSRSRYLFLFHILEKNELNDLWIQVYERAVQDSFSPSSHQKTRYQQLIAPKESRQ